MKEIQLTLSVEETNKILEALGNEPFKSVFSLIRKIQDQASAQLNNDQSVPKPASTPLSVDKSDPEP